MTITDVVLTHSIKIFGQTTSALPGRDLKGKYQFAVQTPFLRISKHGFKPRYVPMSAISDLGTTEQPEHLEEEVAKASQEVVDTEAFKNLPAAPPVKKPGRPRKTDVNG